MHLRRRTLGLLAAGTAAALVAACGAPSSGGPASEANGTVPDRPSKAVSLNILDVAGNLQLTQPMIDDFVAKNPDIVTKVTTARRAATSRVCHLRENA